jgi:hypothetical protein
MGDLLTRTWRELIGRAAGPEHLRLILQPLMASLLASLAGLRDAREGRPPFLWTLASDSNQRRSLLREGWKDVGKIFLIAVVLDVIYSLIVLHRVAPLQTLIVAIILAFVPYLVLRGIVTRLAARLGSGKPQPPAESDASNRDAQASSD